MTVGQEVRIRAVTDDAGDPRFLGRLGRIRRVEDEDVAWSVGQKSDDPLVIVAVPGLGEDAFWTEELEAV